MPEQTPGLPYDAAFDGTFYTLDQARNLRLLALSTPVNIGGRALPAGADLLLHFQRVAKPDTLALALTDDGEFVLRYITPDTVSHGVFASVRFTIIPGCRHVLNEYGQDCTSAADAQALQAFMAQIKDNYKTEPAAAV